MTQDEIIEMWKNSGDLEIIGMPYSMIETFAKLIAEKEREACAKVCELMWHEWLDSPEENEPNKPDAEDCYRAIRRREQT